MGLFEIYRFADKLDAFLMIIGMIGAVIAGAVFPVMFFIFGNLTDAMTAYQFASLAPGHECDTCQDDGSSGCSDADKELMDELLTILWQMCTIGIAMWLGQYVFSVCLNTSAMRQTVRMRKEFLKGTLRQDVGWYDTNTTSDFATKMTEDLNKIQDGIGEKLGMIVRFVITFLGSVAFAFYSNWLISAVLCTIVPIIAVLGGLMGFVLTKASNAESKVYAKAGAIAEEALGSIRTVVAFGGEKKEVENYASELKTAKKNGIVRSILTTSSMGLVFAVMYSVQGLGLWYGVKLIKDEEETDEFRFCAGNCTVDHMKEGVSEVYTCVDEECRRFTIGSVTTALFGIVQGGMQIGQAGTYFESFNTARAAAHGIFEVIDRNSPIDSSSSKGTIPPKLSGKISFNNVYFNYPARKEVNILQGLTLDIEKGMTVALVGGSGCGKSTCIQLVQRFYDPDKGSVSIDGIDLTELNVGWVRDHIGIVGQEPVLFDCTIGENIRYAKPTASFEEIEKACKEANAYAFIQKLPQKYDTMVGEGGTQLSGGQKQRIAIARALIRNPQILLLDEATSALDNESEAIVQDALDRVHAGRTTIVVAHRLTTVRNADLIVALKEGRVAEKGTHEELMEMKGLYHSLVESQLAPKEDTEEQDELEEMEDIKRPESRSSRKLSRDLSKQFSRQMSMVPQDEKEPLENVKITTGRWTLFKKLLKLNSPETCYLIGGIIAAIVFGCLPPLFGVLFGEFISVFQEDHDKAIHDAMIFAIEFTAMGLGFFLALGMQGVMFGIAGENLVERVRKRMLESMLNQEIGWFDEDKNNTGALSSRLSYNAQQVGQATGSKPGQTVGGFTTLIFATGLGLYYNWKLGLVASAFLPPLMFGIMMQLRFMMSESADIKKALESSSKTAVEAISNIRTIFGLRCEKLIIDQFSKSLDGPKKNSAISHQFRAIILGFANSNFFFAYAVVYYYGSHLITHSCPDEFPIDNVFKVAVAVLNGGVFAGIAFQQLLDINKAFAAAETIFEILDRKPTIDSKSSSGKKLDNISGKVDIRNGRFCYPTRSTTKVLRNLTLAIEKGEKIGLVGQSGCGKSTVIQLIQRFYDLNEGVVNVEGNIGHNDEQFNIQAINVPFMRSKLGIVSQEPVLFDRSIADNIKYGDNTREVSMDEVVDAAKKSNIHNFVKDLPQGYDTNVGGKGTQLSGGQKQRVAIARALIR